MLGGSGFDLLHLDPRAIDLFDDVLDGGAPDERLGVFVPGAMLSFYFVVTPAPRLKEHFE